MKKIYLLLLVVSSLPLNAQTNTTPITLETVAKKWVFFDIINPKLSKAEYKENKELLEATGLDFRKDMTYTFSFIMDIEGTWKLDKNTITTVDRRGTNTWTIHKITPTEITLSRNDAEQKIVFKAE